MASLRYVAAVAVLPVVLALPGAAEAYIGVSPTISYDGSYTVSWTEASGGVTRAHLAESFNGGPWSSVTVTGTYSRAYSGRGVGNYSYKIQIYIYDPESRTEIFEYETEVATVLVTTFTVPGAPGAISGPTSNSNGSYAVTWGSASGTVTRYDLYENGAVAYSGMALSASFSGRRNGTYRYKVQACNGVGCGAFTAELVLTVLHEDELTETLPDQPVVQPSVPAQGWVGTLAGAPEFRRDHIPVGQTDRSPRG